MKTYIFSSFLFITLSSFTFQIDTTIIEEVSESELINRGDSLSKDNNINEEELLYFEVKEKMQKLNKTSPMDFDFNEINYKYVKKYLGEDKKLISRMLGVKGYYFPMIENQLDKFQIPLELKYIAIVESALNPKSRSKSGATGIWQFMYPTAKEYGLEVTSYIDERQDPLKSTVAACAYFQDLYNMFEDWNLALAAYNGGPGYLQRTISKTGLTDYWELRPYLRKETQGYVPAFIAVNYVMNYYKDYNIEIFDMHMDAEETDTISFKDQVSFDIIAEMFCVPNEILNYLNPSFKKELIRKGEVICLPKEAVMDAVINEEFFYEYLKKVEKKEILVNERREVYVVQKGDCLSVIGRRNKLKVTDIKDWNKLNSDHLSIGQKIILYIPDEKE